tara:strand:+ start:86 stop:298 length:213 start_codon:yes stop_codon:yes gene_type:complete
MSSIDAIVGFSNLAKKKLNMSDSIIEDMSTKRMEVCNSCPEKKGNACGKCGCNLEAKTRAKTASCPIKKW